MRALPSGLRARVSIKIIGKDENPFPVALDRQQS
jgi:hypothetical protein